MTRPSLPGAIRCLYELVSVLLPSTQGGGPLCVTCKRWGQPDAPQQLGQAAFQCTVTLVAPKDANRPAIVAHMNKGFANELSMGLVALPAHRNLIENTLCSYIDLDIDRFGTFGPF